jgi:hypothetical protein
LCQSNSCKDLNALTQFQKLPKYPHFKQKIKKETQGKGGGCRGGWSHLWGWLAGHPATSRVAAATLFLQFFFKKNFNIF